MFLLSVAVFVNMIRCVISTKKINRSVDLKLSAVENECPLCMFFSFIGLCFQLSVDCHGFNVLVLIVLNRIYIYRI